MSVHPFIVTLLLHALIPSLVLLIYYSSCLNDENSWLFILRLRVCHINLMFSGHISCIWYVPHSCLPFLLSPFLMCVCSGELSAQSSPGSSIWHMGQRKAEWGVACQPTSLTNIPCELWPRVPKKSWPLQNQVLLHGQPWEGWRTEAQLTGINIHPKVQKLCKLVSFLPYLQHVPLWGAKRPPKALILPWSLSSP